MPYPQFGVLDDPFLAIEIEHDFALPALHRRLYEAGLLTHDESRITDRRNFVLEHPTLLLNDKESISWLPPLDILYAYQPASWKLDPQLVEFAQTGNGDSICYCAPWATGDNIPVVEARHDLNEAVCLAPHLEGFIFRRLLDACSELHPAACWRSVDDQVASLRTEVSRLEGYLSRSWLELLRTVVGRPLALRARQSGIGDPVYCLVSEQEAARTIARELAFVRLDEVFAHAG